MAKQPVDRHTLELPGLERPRGRPRLTAPKPGKTRTREYRQRLAQADQERLLRFLAFQDVTLARYTVYGEVADDVAKDCWLELGRRKGWR